MPYLRCMINTHLQQFEFRVGIPEDAFSIGMLAKRVFCDNYANCNIRQDLVNEVMLNYEPKLFEQRLKETTRHFVLAEKSGKLIAFSECETSSEYSEPELSSLSHGVELVRLYVDPDWQRQGIGYELISQAETYTKSLAKPYLWLLAWSKNLKAIAFYQAQGYVNIGTADYVYQEDTFTNCIYQKVF